jgi:hypothetical protein
MVKSGGWWGVCFAIGLLVVGGAASLPTAAESGEQIRTFYAANRQIIIVQQILGILLLVPFLAFARSLDRQSPGRADGNRGSLWMAALVVSAAELATNIVALSLAAIPDPPASTAHALAFAGDLADAGLFAAIAFFSFVAAPADWSWLRGVALLVVAVTLARAFASPLGVTVLDAVAPIAFLAYVLVLSTRVIVADRARRF